MKDVNCWICETAYKFHQGTWVGCQTQDFLVRIQDYTQGGPQQSFDSRGGPAPKNFSKNMGVFFSKKLPENCMILKKILGAGLPEPRSWIGLCKSSWCAE